MNVPTLRLLMYCCLLPVLYITFHEVPAYFEFGFLNIFFSVYLKQALPAVYKTKTFPCLGTRIPFAGPTGGRVLKSLPVYAGEAGDTGLTPESGRSPGGRNGNPLQYACLESCMDRGA